MLSEKYGHGLGLQEPGDRGAKSQINALLELAEQSLYWDEAHYLDHFPFWWHFYNYSKDGYLNSPGCCLTSQAATTWGKDLLFAFHWPQEPINTEAAWEAGQTLKTFVQKHLEIQMALQISTFSADSPSSLTSSCTSHSALIPAVVCGFLW